jgi:hypothetical protein
MATVAILRHQFGGSRRVPPDPPEGARKERSMTATVEASSEDPGDRGCPSWCSGHSETLHYGSDYGFEEQSPSEDDHGLVLTMVEPWHDDSEILTHEEIWIPARLKLSLYQRAGALMPTISFDGPRKPFQLTFTEAQRLVDALTELMNEGWHDIVARDQRPAPSIEYNATEVLA